MMAELHGGPAARTTMRVTHLGNIGHYEHRPAMCLTHPVRRVNGARVHRFVWRPLRLTAMPRLGFSPEQERLYEQLSRGASATTVVIDDPPPELPF